MSGRGELIAAILADSWIESPPTTISLSQVQLDEVTPLLYQSGAGALGWWRVRGTDLSHTSSAEVLHQAYRLQALQAAIHEEKIQKILGLLSGAAVETILVKGWGAAALYPDHGLRPYGDIDLIIRKRDYETALAVVSDPQARDCWIDPHTNVTEISDRTIEELFERSRFLPLGSEQVRVLAAEDHLALLAVHMLKHGAWRPLWVCDLAAAIERLRDDFDWLMGLGRDRRCGRWITCAIGLANRF